MDTLVSSFLKNISFFKLMWGNSSLVKGKLYLLSKIMSPVLSSAEINDKVRYFLCSVVSGRERSLLTAWYQSYILFCHRIEVLHEIADCTCANLVCCLLLEQT